MSKPDIRDKPKDWRPYFSKELQAEMEEFFDSHPELDRTGAMERWIRRGASEYRRKHGGKT
jgi:hypothetical protein